MSQRQRAKYSERVNARKFLEVDGPDEGALGKSATKTGRVGFLTHLQFDFASKHYVGEVKYTSSKAKDPSFRLTRSIIQKIINAARDFNKEPVLIIHFAGLEPIHCITESRHFELLKKERRHENPNSLNCREESKHTNSS